MEEIKKYIRTDIVDARRMRYGEFVESFKVVPDVSTYHNANGFVVYGDEPFWVDERTFKNNFIEVKNNTNLTGSFYSIGEKMVEDFIATKRVEQLGVKTTLVAVELKNGFEIIETSSCVDADNFDMNIGEEICMKKIKDKIWTFLGFLLQSAVVKK